MSEENKDPALMLLIENLSNRLSSVENSLISVERRLSRVEAYIKLLGAGIGVLISVLVPVLLKLFGF